MDADKAILLPPSFVPSSLRASPFPYSPLVRRRKFYAADTRSWADRRFWGTGD